MTLIERMMVPCQGLKKTGSADGLFGQDNSWAPAGAPFRPAIIRKQQREGEEAEQPALHEAYTVVVMTGTPLHYYDAIRRESDSAIFRITADARDTEAPEMSSVQIAKASAERWDPE